jgi:hypothetical protein
MVRPLFMIHYLFRAGKSEHGGAKTAFRLLSIRKVFGLKLITPVNIRKPLAVQVPQQTLMRP